MMDGGADSKVNAISRQQENYLKIQWLPAWKAGRRNQRKMAFLGDERTRKAALGV